MEIEPEFAPIYSQTEESQSSHSPTEVSHSIDTNMKYTILKTLAKSKHKVKLAQDLNSNYVVLKVFPNTKPHAKENYSNEKSSYSKLTPHQNIVNCLDFLEYQIHMKKK